MTARRLRISLMATLLGTALATAPASAAFAVHGGLGGSTYPHSESSFMPVGAELTHDHATDHIDIYHTWSRQLLP